MDDTTQRTITATVNVGPAEMEVTIRLKAPSGVTLKPFVDKVNELLGWMDQPNQYKLEFDPHTVIILATMRADAPVKGRRCAVGFDYDTKLAGNFASAGALHRLTEQGRNVKLVVVPEPKPKVKKKEGKTDGADR